jgi:hypothetical protein
MTGTHAMNGVAGWMREKPAAAGAAGTRNDENYGSGFVRNCCLYFSL